MRITVITPTYTYQSAQVMRAEGSWEECRRIFADERLDTSGQRLRIWVEEALEPYFFEGDSLGFFISRQEVITRDGIKCVVEFDPPPPVTE